MPGMENNVTRSEKLNDYDGFVEKFKPKRTTDDCFTPQEVYEAILGYVCNRWGIDRDKVVRPFWPGGNYKEFTYPAGAVVVDNPPFSILAEIQSFYLDNGIDFFLFAPSLTAFSGKRALETNHIICGCDIEYENGALVRTSFITSFGRPNVLESCPELTRLVNDVVKKRHKEKTVTQPKYTYPLEIVTAAMVQRYCKYGVAFSVSADEAVQVRALDSQRAQKKAVFGGGLLLSPQKAAERAAAERAAATIWGLSERERQISNELGKN